MQGLEVHPVTPDRWADFESVMGPNGASAGCWCMWWRVASRKDFEGPTREHGPRMKGAMKRLVRSGVVPGVIAYVDGVPAVWCSIAPREDFAALERSRSYARLDDQPVWSVVCFYTAKPFRGSGLLPKVLRAASEYARDRGARIVEGYPKETDRRVAPADVYMGTAGAFGAAGFREAGRTANGRPVMRRTFRTRAAR
jgi:GNAT superfamily N-acetyltransferase